MTPTQKLREAEKLATKGPWLTEPIKTLDQEKQHDIEAHDKDRGVLPLGRFWDDNAVWLPVGEAEANADLVPLMRNTLIPQLDLIDAQQELIGWTQMMPDSDSPDYDKWVAHANELGRKVASARRRFEDAVKGAE